MKMMKTMMIFITGLLGLCLGKDCDPCGNMQVPYPLTTDPSSCGVPGYNLYCNNGNLDFMSRDGFNYSVLSINSTEERMIIKTPDIRVGSGCITGDEVFGGMYINEDSPFTISTRNTVMLLNCSERLLLSPLNCSSNSVCHQFVDSFDEAKACRNKLCCSFLKDTSYTNHRIRVHEGGCTAYTSVVSMDASLPPSQWNFGVEIQWIPVKF